MKVGYLCRNGHLTVGNNPENTSGKMFERINCIHCGEVASIFDEFSLSESVPVHFEFFKAGILHDKDQIELAEKGYLLIRLVEDPIITKEFQATESITKLAYFLLENIEEIEKKEDIVDTAISLLQTYFNQRKLAKVLGMNQNKNLN